MNKKRVSLYASIILATLIIAASVLFLQNSGVGPFAKQSMIVFATGTPDALGNRIVSVQFWQNSTGTWAQVASLTYSAYVLNYNLTIPANQHTLIYCNVYLNDTLAPDWSTAVTRVRVYLTIGGVVTSASMIGSSATHPTSYWNVQLYYPSSASSPTTTWTPATDTTYTITFQYQAYY